MPMKKMEELKRCFIADKEITPMNCATCECEGCSNSEKAKEHNAGVAS
jgi:hypothetical protein